jgi:hypothetical protein
MWDQTEAVDESQSGPSRNAFAPSLLSVLTTFPIATPELIAARELHRRVDTKLMLPVRQLERVFGALGDDYAVLLAGNHPLASYRTLYFDTPALHCFHDHRRGRFPRHKIRIRHYTDRHLSYLEVKRKKKPGDMEKRRRQLEYLATRLSAEDQRFIDETSPFNGAALVPVLWTDFRRITLIGLHTAERVTLDFGLRFRTAEEESSRSISPTAPADIVIAEIKQAHAQPRSPIFRLLRGQQALRVNVSKYCTAAALLFAPTRSKLHIPVLRAVARLQRG